MNTDDNLEIESLQVGNLLDLYGTVATLQVSDFYYHYSTEHRKLTRFKPIRITGDWLLQLGFTQIPNNMEDVFKLGVFEYYTSTNEIWIEFDGLGGAVSYSTYVYYVHELQNLAPLLTGEKLKYTPKKL